MWGDMKREKIIDTKQDVPAKPRGGFMRKGFVIALIMVLALGTLAFAETTGRGDYTTPISPLTTWLDDNPDFYHNHPYNQYDPRMELGIMGDVILWEDAFANVPYTLGVQSQYDFNNQNWGFYSKVSVNLSPMIKKFLGR